jgi:hypothetical protein
MPGFKRGFHVFFRMARVCSALRRDQVLTFVDANAISTSPGPSGLLAFGLELR